MNTHETRLRVKYQETDAMGVVYYGNYFTWLEVGRAELLRDLGMPYSRIEEMGYRMMVVEAHCSYKQPARYDDLVTVETWVSDLKNTSIVFRYSITLGEKLLAEGESTHVITDKAHKPVKIPNALREVLSGA